LPRLHPGDIAGMMAGKESTINVLWGPQRQNHYLVGWMSSSQVRQDPTLWPRKLKGERDPKLVFLPFGWYIHSGRSGRTHWLPTAISTLPLIVTAPRDPWSWGQCWRLFQNFLLLQKYLCRTLEDTEWEWLPRCHLKLEVPNYLY
jgi:hypothetical protein